MRRHALALALAALPAAAETRAAPQFVPESGGLVHEFRGGWQYMVGGGVAAFDCSGDGLPDLAMAGGEAPAALFVNESRPGALRFSRAAAAGVEMTGVTGLWPLDVDADGQGDLFVARVGENVLLRGLGGCRFARANETWGYAGGDDWTTAFAATWEQGAAFPTLAQGNYIDRREEAFPWGSCTPNILTRPEGRRFGPPLPLRPSHCALSMLFTDWDRSGRPALRVSNDREYYKGGQEQLWRLAPGAPPAAFTEAEGWARLRIWGMGIAAADLDGDGYNEYFLTSMADNKLQHLEDPAAPRYTDIAPAAGATAHRPYTGGDVRPSTAWHPAFADVDNDGWLDLFVTKGNVSEMPDFAARDPNNLLMGRPDGRFVEAGAEAGLASMAQGRGAAVVDLDGDGRLDVVVVNRNAPAGIWRNAGPAGGWVAIAPRNRGANRDAVNAWVEVRAAGRVQRREVLVGGGHGGGTLGPQHFGLGAATQAEARVIWPDGTEGPWRAVPLGQVSEIAR